MIPENVYLVLCDFETTGVELDDVSIEVGLLILDPQLRIVGAYESLIRRKVEFNDHTLDALAVHRINYVRAMASAPGLGEVANRIARLVAERVPRGKKAVLCSDNIQFEYRHMRDLFIEAAIEFPFHYCGWDTSMLLEATGVGDPKPKHRAMADVGLVYSSLVEAYRRLRK